MVRPPPNTADERRFFTERGRMRTGRPKKTTVTFVETPLTKSNKSKGNPFRNTRSGARADLDGLVVRSNWEANVIRVLKLFGIHFLFEPIVFEFPLTPAGKHRSYLPDIYLPKTDEFIEVKGYLDGNGRSKLRNFKKFFPEEFSKLTVIISKSNKTNNAFFKKLGVPRILHYEHLSKLYADKINWEGAK